MNSDDTDIDDLVARLRSSAAELRAQKHADASRVFGTVLDAPSDFSGKAFVESEGLVLDFFEGVETNNIYTSASLTLRSPVLALQEDAREEFFARLLNPLDGYSPVLNIGCGGDLAIEKAASEAGIAIVHTDASADVVESLCSEVGGRAFSANLVDLGPIVPDDSFDLIVGNSVMAYVAPHEMARALEQVARIARRGCVFTFDMTPHPCYFRLFDGRPTPSVINESGGDPRKLDELIDAYGPDEAPGAFWHHHILRSHFIQVVLMRCLRTELKRHGLTVQISRTSLQLREDSMSVWILRAARDPDGDASILTPLEDELRISDDDESWREGLDEKARAFFVHIDRNQARPIARKLGLPHGARDAPWEVLRFVNGRDHHLSDETRVAVEASFDLESVEETIAEAIRRAEPPKDPRLPQAIALDQSIRAQCIRGQIPQLAGVPEHEARAWVEEKIDRAYSIEKSKAARREGARADAKKRKRQKSRAKDARKKRRKNR